MDGGDYPLGREIVSDIPHKLRFLLEPHPYKVVYSGRYGLKTRSAVIALLNLGARRPLRILCCREVMRSIRESLHQELREQINDLGLGSYYTVLDTEIRGGNGTTFIFSGLHGHSAESIKSYAGVDIVLIDEAQAVEKRSWDILIPTVRKPGSEFWVLFNPESERDDTWTRWVVNPLPGTVVVKTSWRDAQEVGWFPEQENQKRLHFKRTQPDDYDNIWEGEPRSTVEGAIYRREMVEAQNEGRLRAMPYDPRLPVHTVWDLGWADSMAVVMLQKPHPSVVHVINYFEDRNRRHDEVLAVLDRLGYRWGTDYLPHDGGHGNRQTGMSDKQLLRSLGRRDVRVIGEHEPGLRGMPVEDGIRLGRMMFPRIYIDNSARPSPNGTGHLGGGRLIECLQHYRWVVPKATDEATRPLHDQYSHGADAVRYLAMVVDQIRNEGDRDVNVSRTRPFAPADASVGMLG